MNDIQVWNNAAFDDHGDDAFFPMKTSWSSSECTKENLSPTALNSSPKPKKNTKTKAFALSSDDNRNIDDEIEAIEREITRLTTRLDALRLEKAKRGKRVVGRAVPAKFMEPRPNAAVLRKLEETPKTKVKSTNNNHNAWRRGMSMGPAEIAATPASTQSRRKSCFWKLPEIEEESRAKTVGRVKKKEESWVVQGQIQARKMFEREKVKSVCESNKKTVKQGRMVASRYNGGGDVRKRSLPEGGNEIRVKKRWEIPKNGEEEEAVSSMVAGEVMVLPKIKTVKCVNESPRDSGAAKRVAELVGKRPYFCTDENDVCQVLNFVEEEEGG
ncbi:hypothetical protein LR48_Vigan05g089100 [Vigna angularis]|uniref:Uncharacterized protein n=2 Tax=Phaseolus angularis TaxID=3914 RepID=A0A0L9UL34_PHAAN|nr:hypothetical protein LR48_Vigan05g089100 [Vigna angularis]BAT92743.1 hypothetical protein VIGAN_07156300 [Vigna angularis var. angularis]